MALTSLRGIRDAKNSVTKALPAANATNQSGTIDLGPGPYHPEGLMLEIAIPALANNIDSTKSVTIKLQDSADDITYADVDALISTTVAGVASTGSAAKTVTIHLPPNVRRYIQFNQAVVTGGGDNTASSVTYSLLT